MLSEAISGALNAHSVWQWVRGFVECKCGSGDKARFPKPLIVKYLFSSASIVGLSPELSIVCVLRLG